MISTVIVTDDAVLVKRGFWTTTYLFSECLFAVEKETGFESWLLTCKPGARVLKVKTKNEKERIVAYSGNMPDFDALARLIESKGR